MANNLKIKKYWITTLCMVFCSLATFAQNLSDAKSSAEQGKKEETNKAALASPEILAQEKAALIAFYNSTNGAAWKNTVNNEGAWPINDPNAVVTRWNSATKTGWYGITLLSAEGRVQFLNLSNNNVTGTVPNLGGLTELVSITLNKNKITGGNIDAFSELTKLSFIDVSSCKLDGNLQSLMKLTDLQNFIAPANNITGTFPEDFYKLSKLKELDVYLNKLEGDYSLLGQIPTLTILALTGNNFNKTGSPDYNNRSIPESFKNLTNLTSLRLEQNGLKNNLKVVGNMVNLANLQIDNNLFEGALPSELSALKKLNFFSCSGNAITEISALSGANLLQTVTIQSNLITSLPPEFAQFPNLTSIIASRNKLSGPLIDLTSSKLTYFDISGNYYRFVDMEPVFSRYKNLTPVSFIYSPQAKTDQTETISRAAGTSVTLSMSDDGVHRYTDNDKFQWYKGFYPSGVLIPSGESRQLTLSNLKLSDAGYYYCLSTHPQITNAAAASQNLILERQSITLLIATCPTIAGSIKTTAEKFYTNTESSFTFETTATGLTYEWSVATAAGTPVNAAPSNTIGSYSYTFSEAGDYIVTLIAKDAKGCATTFTKPIQVINERYCAKDPINFGFETATPNLNYTWICSDASGNIVHTVTNTTGLYTFTPQLAGDYEVELIVKTATSCKTLFTKNITVEDCTPIVSCTVNNPLTQKVHSLFINLITKLENTPNGTDVNVYARNEIIALSSYVAGTTNSIYNFSNSGAAVTFSFSQNGAENDVYIPKSGSGAISGIDLSKYFGAQGTTAVTTNYSNGTNGSGGYVRNIDFCPIAECIPITGVINIVKKATAQAKRSGQSSTNAGSKI
ncbi:hypothetical protein [Flavobacterium sp. ENC]|uniref:hypothetical protein n=1 Tax=Flavobacterium sp. ENC TaxID=2897330 RepID=UPI001E35147F|nr:hypothetical protein [Flavobacterium sp. ENC]MCD0467444.1 hypothetical protein [Flavobacterium sp. ENC]